MDTEVAPIVDPAPAADLSPVFVRHFRMGPNPWQLSPKGGATLVVAQDASGKLYAGVSVCSKADPFNKKVGRWLALQRAEAARLTGLRALYPQRYDKLGEQVLARLPGSWLVKLLSQ